MALRGEHVRPCRSSSCPIVTFDDGRNFLLRTLSDFTFHSLPVLTDLNWPHAHRRLWDVRSGRTERVFQGVFYDTVLSVLSSKDKHHNIADVHQRVRRIFPI